MALARIKENCTKKERKWILKRTVLHALINNELYALARFVIIREEKYDHEKL